MTPSEEAIEAAEKKIVQAITGFVREHKTISSEELTKDVLTAALPSIEKQIRAEVAAEIRVEMRRHDTAQIGFSAIGDAYAHAARIARGQEQD